jgi:hypothetical protein
MKEWFTEHKKCFVLGLSLDGNKETHNLNRDNSFELIDINFFLNTWPDQGIKMTLSEFSLLHLAENIKFIHSLGFKHIKGVNLAEGNFDWNKEKYINILIPQLEELVEYYLKNESLLVNQMFDKQIHYCEFKNKKFHKWCGIGTGCFFFDTNGERYPCSFITPMTFSKNELSTIMATDFHNNDIFTDDECFNNCYIYPICPICYGSNYLNCKTFKLRDKSRFRIQKLIVLFVAELHARKIINNQYLYNKKKLYSIIEAIKKIKELYLKEFEEYFL